MIDLKEIKPIATLKIATVISTLLVASTLGLVSLKNNDKYVQVATIDEEEIYVTEDISFDDFNAYIDMVNYEIEQMGGEVTLDDVDFINGEVSEKSVIARLNAKIMRREPDEIKDKTENNKYKLSREILMKQAENISVEYLLELKVI